MTNDKQTNFKACVNRSPAERNFFCANEQFLILPWGHIFLLSHIPSKNLEISVEPDELTN